MIDETNSEMTSYSYMEKHIERNNWSNREAAEKDTGIIKDLIINVWKQACGVD